MAKGFDCATPLTQDTAQQFASAGFGFVCRYFPVGYTKSLTLSEAKAISDSGMKIVSVFETYANRALEGYEAGLQDGKRAENAAGGVMQPVWSTIYFAVDFDVTNNDQMAAVKEYIRGCSEATPNYTTGVYGEKEVIDAVAEAGVCSHFWQTYAWSRGEKSQYANIYQYKNGESEFGVAIDLNESYGEEGWWSVEEPKQEQEYLLSVEDANHIIERWIQHEYDLASDKDKDDRHRFAKALRKASGQSEEGEE